MPAPIAHMLISRRTRAALRAKAQAGAGTYPAMAAFTEAVTDKHPRVMELGPYKKRHKELFGAGGQLIRDSAPCREFIDLQSIPGRLGPYDAYVDRAVELAVIYIRALYRLYESAELEDRGRARFRRVVRNADLSSPLDTDLFADAAAALAEWEHEATAC